MVLSKEQNTILKQLFEMVDMETGSLDDSDKLEVLEEFHDKLEGKIDTLRNEIEEEDLDDDDDDDDDWEDDWEDDGDE
jgi:hypothetical protein